MTTSKLSIEKINNNNHRIIINEIKESFDNNNNEKDNEDENFVDKIRIQIDTKNINLSSSSVHNLSTESCNKSSRKKHPQKSTKTRGRKRLYSSKTNKKSTGIINNNKIKIEKEEESENIPIENEQKLNNQHQQLKQSIDDDDNNNEKIKKSVINNKLLKQKSLNRRLNSKKNTRQQNSNVITNYFPIVSRRLLAAKLNEEAFNQRIIDCIVKQVDPIDYLAVTEFQTKGKAIIAKLPIMKGSFICEYSGDLIDLDLAKKRELLYERNRDGCYMYYFNWNSTIWCVDATKPTGRLGRLINHSRKSPNCKTKIFEYEQRPHLIFIALRDIKINEEILYDYGERDPNAIKSHPWLTT